MKQLYIITGFLGAGKTTFINMMLKTYAGRRFTVIINEFGKLGVDTQEYAGRGYEVREILGGSIFCVCRMDMFIDALIAAARSSPELLLVETSGLSDPACIDYVLSKTKDVSGECFDYRGCVCLVDALNFEKVYATAVVVPSQIRQCSLAVINRVDVASEAQVRFARQTIRELNGCCEIYETSYAQIPEQILSALRPLSPGVTGGRQDVLSGSLSCEILGKPDVQVFRHMMREMQPILYRCKGYMELADGQYHVDGVMNDLSITRTDKPQPNGLVMLYNTTRKVKTALQRAAEQHCIDIKLM